MTDGKIIDLSERRKKDAEADPTMIRPRQFGEAPRCNPSTGYAP